MAAKKKPNPGTSEANASTDAIPTNDNTLDTTNGDNTEDNGEDLGVEDLADGDFEVGLHDLGISTEDIQTIRRIDTRLSGRLRKVQAQQTQANTSLCRIRRAPVATTLQPHHSSTVRWGIRPKRFPPQVRSGHRSIRGWRGMQSESICPLAEGPRSALVLQPPRWSHPHLGPAP